MNQNTRAQSGAGSADCREDPCSTAQYCSHVCEAWVPVGSSGLGGASETQGHGSRESSAETQGGGETAWLTRRSQPSSESLLHKAEPAPGDEGVPRPWRCRAD